MSHTTSIKTVAINDIAALRKTVEDLNKMGVKCTLEENAKPRMYYAHQEEKCAYVLRLDAAKCKHTGKNYDVGFRQEKDGNLTPIFDEYGGGIANQLGFRLDEKGISPEERSKRTIGKFLQNFAGNAAINKAKKQGYAVASRKLDTKTGALHIRLSV